MLQSRLRFTSALLALWLLAAPLVLSAITVTRVTCATTATLAYTAASGGSTVLFRNAGTASVYLGPAGVATTTGFELLPDAAIQLPLGPLDPVYCIVATATQRMDAVESRR